METEILVMDCEERGAFWLTLGSDYRILFAATGEEGIELLSGRTALVFLSLTLGDTDSMELLGLITRKYPSLPVIITAPCGPEKPCLCMEAFRRGARDYMEKPLNAEEALRKIGTMLTQGNAQQERGEISSAETTPREEQYRDVPTHLVSGVVKVKDFIAQNFSEPLSLADACRMAATSKTYFCRFFRRITGHSLGRYQHAVKVHMAEQLLRDGRLSVTDVAIRLGYSDSNYFSTIYKKLTGVSPRSRKTADLRTETGKEAVNRVQGDVPVLLIKTRKRQHV